MSRNWGINKGKLLTSLSLQRWQRSVESFLKEKSKSIASQESFGSRLGQEIEGFTWPFLRNIELKTRIPFPPLEGSPLRVHPSAEFSYPEPFNYSSLTIETSSAPIFLFISLFSSSFSSFPPPHCSPFPYHFFFCFIKLQTEGKLLNREKLRGNV